MDLLKPSYATGYAKNASQSAHPNLWDGLVGAWMPSMGDCGWDLNDLSGRGNHAELDGRSSPAPLKVIDGSRQIVPDGSSDYFRVNNVKDFSPKELTYCYWVTQPVLAGTYAPGGVWRTGRRSWLSQHVNGYPQFFHSNDGSSGASITSSVSLISNKLTCVVMRYGKGSKQIWQNGVRTALATGAGVSGDLFDSQTEFCMGSFLFYDSSTTFGRNWQGGISAQMVYNRALSPLEIKQLYVDSLAPFRTKKRTVVRVPAAIPAATKVGSFKKPTTIIKPSYQSGYARNASESENPNLWDGLVGAWMPSLGVTGETLRDVSGNGNHGTLTGMDAASDWVATSKGLALEFDGSDDRVLAGDLETLDNMSIQFTVRVNSNPGSFRGFLGAVGYTGQDYDSGFNLDMGSASTTAFETLSFEGGIRRISFGTNLMVSSVDFGVWCNMCLVVSSSEITLFLNGVKESSATRLNNSTSTIGMNDFVIGKRPYSGVNTCVEADFANVSVYNRTLSPSEIKHLYVDSLAPFRKKQRVSVAVPAAVPTPSATYHPLRSLAHPLEQ